MQTHTGGKLNVVSGVICGVCVIHTIYANFKLFCTPPPPAIFCAKSNTNKCCLISFLDKLQNQESTVLIIKIQYSALKQKTPKNELIFDMHLKQNIQKAIKGGSIN